MIWIGLTGGIATGKSTASNLLKSMGYPVIDADVIAREATDSSNPIFHKIVKKFGASILNDSGQIDRKKLGAIVFQDTRLRSELELLIHPYVRDRQREEKEKLIKAGTAVAFYDVPLLFEKNLENDFDYTLMITCSESEQIARLINRDKISQEEARLRIHSQLPLKEKEVKADFVINNQGTVLELELQLKELIDKITKPKNNQKQ